jgi:hypothetical protein
VPGAAQAEVNITPRGDGLQLSAYRPAFSE